MKKIIFLMFCYINIYNNNISLSQTYKTESKSCGSCYKAVSINSSIGDYCPHCGVRWGYENTTKSTKKTYNYPTYSPYDKYTIPSIGTVYSNSNLRSFPSRNSSVVTVIPAYSSFDIIERQGSWYYVKYTKISLSIYGSNKEYEGYIHKSLVR
jgi:predicted RNA-binding Zn-ribbon protein involved in translation (DUF1610 family)